MNKATVFAMGGTPPKPKQQLEMRLQMIEATGKAKPRILYIPPDGGESTGHWPTFKKRFSSHGCQSEPLFLLRERPGYAEMERLVGEADLVFVGGGNTLRMMRMWRRFGIDRLLIEAAKEDKVLAGVSAGAICWFEFGHSDSRSFSGKESWPYLRVRGLGIVKGTFCPHVRAENRLDDFEAMICKFGGTGFGADDGSALVVSGGRARVLGKAKGVYRVTRSETILAPAEFVL